MAEILLQASGLTKAYGEGGGRVEVLKGLDLAVHAGEFLAVLGPSGSGKSTMLNLFGLMDRPSAGEVSLFGAATSALSDAERASLRNLRVGFVFQFDSLLPDFTVLENILMPALISGAVEPARKRACELMERLKIAPLAGRFPTQLSGGERQRAAIARALVNGPGVILADEPTGNLDRPNGELVFSSLRELADALAVAVVMVTHNETASDFASRSIHLSDGRVRKTAEVS